VEALARWRHGGRLLDTGEFLALAERTGQIVEIGSWVTAEACRQVARWNTAHPDRRPLRLAVNISARELARPSGPADIERALVDAGLDPTLVCLEVREDVLQPVDGSMVPAIAALRDLGVRLSVDDFGTGATSVATLIDHRVHELKVDRRFVSQMDLDSDAAAVVRGIVRLAQSLQMHTVAEGVERETQEQMLHALGCDAAQGWLYARPAADLAEVLRLAETSLERSLAHRAPEPRPLWNTMPSARAAARFIETVFETSPIGMALVDAEGRHLATNPALAELLGHASEDLLGSTCWETVHPADLHADLSAMDALLAGEQASYSLDERVVDATGGLRWVQVTVTGVPREQQAEGLPTVLLRQVQSIERRRRSTEEAALLQSIIESSPDPVIITDGRGRCSRWNPAAERLFGWARDEALGAPLTVLVPPEEQPTLARAIARAANGQSVRWADATWVAADGSPRPVDVTLGPVADESTREIGLVVLVRDVDEQRNAAAVLHAANEALEARAVELAEANSRLAELASTLTHDLMQPVSTMSGFLSLLERGAEELEEDHREWLEGALRGRDRIVQAIDALYRHATAEDVPLVAVDLEEVVSGLLPDLLPEPGARVDRDPLPVVCGDPGLIGQVVANLLQNASRYRCPDRELAITLRVVREPGAWVLAVCDNGQGIAPEDAERVFEPGVRGGAATGTNGTGIGLATVRSLMQRMGGAAWVEPTHGTGAQVCLRFAAFEPEE
jgi:PAS domain S-box-containing protein